MSTEILTLPGLRLDAPAGDLAGELYAQRLENRHLRGEVGQARNENRELRDAVHGLHDALGFSEGRTAALVEQGWQRGFLLGAFAACSGVGLVWWVIVWGGG